MSIKRDGYWAGLVIKEIFSGLISTPYVLDSGDFMLIVGPYSTKISCEEVGRLISLPKPRATKMAIGILTRAIKS